MNNPIKFLNTKLIYIDLQLFIIVNHFKKYYVIILLYKRYVYL